MNNVFEGTVRQIADGNLENLYAVIGFSLDCEELASDGTVNRTGSVSVYSRNNVPIAGKIISEHPCILIEDNTFSGNSTIRYQIIPSAVGFLENTRTDGILILYNGGELKIPFHQIPAAKSAADTTLTEKRKTDETVKKTAPRHNSGKTARERRLLTELASCIIKIFASSDEKNTFNSVSGEISVKITDLLELYPDSVMYQLYQGIYAAKAGNFNIAARIEGKLRGEVTSGKKRHFTEYCLLLYLQYYICIFQRQDREAQVKRRQLLDYINNALVYESARPELPLLLGSDILNLIEEAPEELWNSLQDLWESGNNSPYLYILGARLLYSAGVIRLCRDKINSFFIHCAKEAIRNNLATEELAEVLTGVPVENYSVFTFRTLNEIYGKFPGKALLSTVTLMAICAELKTDTAFLLYSRALDEKLRIPRLYDYYVWALPSDYRKQIPEEIIRYYARDSYIRPEIMIKLCLNIVRFYRDNDFFVNRFLSGAVGMLRNRIIKKNWSEDLALLAGEILDPDMIDEDFARALVPMLYLVQVYANVADGCKVVYESDVFRMPETGVIEQGKCCLSIPGEYGKFHVLDAGGQIMNSVNLKIVPLMASEELMDVCSRKCPDEKKLMVLMLHAKLTEKQYKDVNPAECIDGLADEELTDSFHRIIMDYCLENLSAYGPADNAILCKNAGLCDSMQLPVLITHLAKSGRCEDALDFLISVTMDLIPVSVLYELAKDISDTVRMQKKEAYGMLLKYLLAKGEYNAEMLNWMKSNFSGTNEDSLKLYEICIEQKLNTSPLGANLLERLLLTENGDIRTMATILSETADNREMELLSRAVMNKVCYAYVCGYQEPMEGVLSFLQGSIIHEGSADEVTLPCKLAMLKYDSESMYSHEAVTNILKEFYRDIRDKNLLLDFVEKESAKWGFYSIPVFSCDMSEHGSFGKNMMNEIAGNHAAVYAEYMVNGDNTVYQAQAYHAYATIFSAPVVQFAAEKIRYRFRVGQETTRWITADRFLGLKNGNPDPKQKVNSRYLQLQHISGVLEQGLDAAPEISEFRKNLKIVSYIKNLYKDNK